MMLKIPRNIVFHPFQLPMQKPRMLSNLSTIYSLCGEISLISFHRAVGPPLVFNGDNLEQPGWKVCLSAHDRPTVLSGPRPRWPGRLRRVRCSQASAAVVKLGFLRKYWRRRRRADFAAFFFYRPIKRDLGCGGFHI